jgi:hypothetical protein
MDPEGLSTCKKFGLCTLSLVGSISCIHLHIFLKQFNLSSHLSLDLPRGLLTSVSSIHVLYMSHISWMFMSRLYVLLNYILVFPPSRILIAAELSSRKNFPNLVVNAILMCQCHFQIFDDVSIDDPSVLGCCNLSTGTSLPMFRRNVVPSILGSSSWSIKL